MYRRFTLLLLISSLLTSTAFSEETHQLGTIVITPSRLKIQSNQSTRSIVVIDEDMMDSSSYDSISDLIGNLGGADIRRRGPEGVQSDINIRGSTFEENTVLIDGVRISDPQTGHYNMDLPITLADVDRIEILKGPASSLYGPNSFGGTINIITKIPDTAKIIFNAEGGSYDYFSSYLSATHPVGILKNRFSFEERRSSGYMPETEFNIMTLSDNVAIDTDYGNYNFIFGYAKKDFSADSFYSNLYNNEEEHTDTRFFKISGKVDNLPLKIEPKLFLKRHRDKFILDTNRPGWQTNYHTTYSYGGEVSFILENNFSDVVFGYELSQDTIDSTNIQTHARTNDGMYIEISPHVGDELYMNIGMREDYFSGFGWEYSPSFSISYIPIKFLTLRGLIGRAYRIPTFTDLYYNDVANIGNPDLKSESSWSYEAGFDYRIDILDCSATFFHRDSSDTIDWTRLNSRLPWRVSNIGSIDTNGLELSLKLMPKKIDKMFPVNNIFLN